MKLYRTDWNIFPKTVIDRGLGDATSHYMYEAAKAGEVIVTVSVVPPVS